MSNLQTIPEPYSTDVLVKGSYGDMAKEWRSMLPYSSLEWKGAVSHYNITVPEKMQDLVDLSMGVSTCKECGHRVAGFQSHCDNEVHWMRVEGRWHDQRMPKDQALFTGDLFHEKDRYSTNKVTYVQKKKCVGEMTWDMSERFNEQKRFYDFLMMLPVDTHSDFAVFKDVVPDIKDAELAYLRYKVMMMEMNQEQIKGALRMIADKMNTAGSALSFGF